MAEKETPAGKSLIDENPGTGSEKALRFERFLLVILTAVVCMTVVTVYWSVLSAKALSFDDGRYFVENPLVRNPSLESARRFFVEMLEPSTVGGYYQPLTMTSLMIDYALSTPGDELRSFHRTSLALHTANTALIIIFLYLLFGRVWIAAAIGLLFGLHPLTVETVAWVGERKTLLAAFFSFLSLVLYMGFIRRRGRKFLAWSLLMYALALLSKPTSTPLPVMMILMDFWPLKRLKLTSILEKLPFFVVGSISAVITYISQDRTASILTPDVYGVMRVPLVICHNIIFYLWKIILPLRLTSHYPFPSPLDLSQPLILTGVIGTALLVVALLVSLRWTLAPLIGWLVFFVMVLPTMQALQFSDVIASDKFVYLPSIGILMILAAFLGWLSGSKQHPCSAVICYGLIPVIVLVLACGEAFVTRKYLVSWKDSTSLFKHMVEVVPTAVSPRNNYGVALAEAGNFEEAEKQFNIVLQADPNNPDASYNLGNIMARRGNIAEARRYYEKSFVRGSDEADSYQAVGVLLVQEGKLEEAIELYRSALAQEKMGLSFLLREGLGSIFIKMGRIDDAIRELEIAVEQHASSTAYANLGLAVASKGQIDKAEEYYKKAIRLDPTNAEAHFNLGNLYLSVQRLDDAAAQYRSAIKAKPEYVKAHANLAVALSQMNRLDEAIVSFRRAAELDPNNPDGFYNLAIALQEKGLTDEALEIFTKVVRLAPSDINARIELARLFMQMGQNDKASAELEEILKIDPNNPAAQSGLMMLRQFKDSDPNTKPSNP